MPAPPRTRLTLEEFLAWEEQQPGRHEFVDGEVFAMTGGTLNHNLLINNLIIVLTPQLRRRNCLVFHEGARVHSETDLLYPDIVVSCAAQQSDPRIVQAPRLIAEVLSSATERHDRGKKWTLYQRLPSLQAYLLVAQDAAQVDLFRRTTGGWHFSHHAGLDAVIELADPPCRVALAELYADLIDPLPA